MGRHTNWTRESMAVARMAVDRQEAREAELPCERTEAEDLAAEGLAGYDPECRFARDGFELGLHACTRRDGRLVEAGEAGQCWSEQRAQLAEQGQLISEAGKSVTA